MRRQTVAAANYSGDRLQWQAVVAVAADCGDEDNGISGGKLQRQQTAEAENYSSGRLQQRVVAACSSGVR